MSNKNKFSIIDDINIATTKKIQYYYCFQYCRNTIINKYKINVFDLQWLFVEEC